MKKGTIQRILVLFAVVTFWISAIPMAFADTAKEDRRVVRVAFPEQVGMSKVGYAGKLSGYNYDYLEKISEFTGWKMEYIYYSADDGNEAVGSAMADLMEGKVDLLGPMLKSPATEEMFEYPATSYGTVYTTLCAEMRGPMRKYDINTERVLKVGLWDKATTRNQEVMDYLEREGIQGEIHYYHSYEAQVQALRDGKVDVISGVSLSPPANTRILARFAPRPYYFASTKGNTELMRQLDRAMQELDELQPELQEKLFDAYFMDAVNAFYLTDAQKAALAGKNALQVLCVDGDAPYVYQDNGQAKGALVQAIEEFAAQTGLRVEYTFCGSQAEAEHMLTQSKHFDMLMGMPFTSDFCAENGYVRAEPVFSAGMSLVRKSAGGNYAAETVGIVRGLEDAFDTSKFRNVMLFNDARDCIQALKEGIVDVAAGDRSVMDHYLYEAGAPYVTSAIVGITHSVSVAVSRENMKEILGILNSYINSMSSYQRTVYLDAGGSHLNDVTLAMAIARNPVPALFIGTAITALVVGSILVLVYSANMRRKDQQLAIATQAKNDFLSRMSHDIRTPLNGIIGLLKINEDHFEDRNLVWENNEKMTVASRHLLSLVNDVLEMGELEDGVEDIVCVPATLTESAKDIMETIREEAAQKTITIVYKGTKGLPNPRVMASPLHLRQIFMNIYRNSIKFTPPGGTIATYVECLGQKGNTITYRWTITDTGIGMSQEFLKHIYEPFSQEYRSARTVYQGTGLGMSIVKGLVDRMHGSIDVTSQKGVGTTVELTLPFEMAEVRQEEEQSTGIAGLNLLMAEDNELNAEIAKMLIEDQGAKLTVVPDGRQAVEAVKESPAGAYDAILMDVMMPVMDGLEATRAIRQLNHPDAKKIPIIAITANAFAEDVRKCREAGMDAHLPKPIEIEKVVAVLSQYCKKEQ